MLSKNMFVLSLLLLITACGPSSQNWREQWLPVLIDNPAPVSDFTDAGIADGSILGEQVGVGVAEPGGGTIESEDGRFIVTIPPGAVSEDVEFTIIRYEATTNALPGSYIPTSPVYKVEPSYVFSEDVTISIVLDLETIQALNLRKSATQAFTISDTPLAANTLRFPGWGVLESRVEADRLLLRTRTFSLFGAGSPPPGNQPPLVLANFVFDPTISVPTGVCAFVSDPDGDAFDVYLLAGPAGGALNALPMPFDGGSGCYKTDLFYEAINTSGILTQVIAVDTYGANFAQPNGLPFLLDASSYPLFNIDRDGDNLLDLYELRNGYDPANPGDPAVSLADSDGDLIPDSADFTPNNESFPDIDTLVFFPDIVQMSIGEQVSFGLIASQAGGFRYVNVAPNIMPDLSGLTVGAFLGGTDGVSVLLANTPGSSTIWIQADGIGAFANVTVLDSLAPDAITDLAASAMSHTSIRLDWTAPGDDGATGIVSLYEIRQSITSITNDSACDAAAAVAHNVSPLPGGFAQNYTINGFSPNTRYYFCVRAYDESGNRSSWSGIVAVTTQPAPDLTPPADVLATDVTLTVTGPDSIQLDWLSVGDDGLTGLAAAYEIRYSTNVISDATTCENAVQMPNALTPTLAGSPLGFTLTGLSEYTFYWFCIFSFDDANNRNSWSGELSGRTFDGNDSPVADAGTNQAIDISAGVVNLAGSASLDPDAGVCTANTGNYSYNWRFVTLPGLSLLSDAAITGANTLTASFTPDVLGTYVIGLFFTDDPGLCSGGAKTGYDTVIVTVANTPPTVSVLGNTYDYLSLTYYTSTDLNWTSDQDGIFEVRIGGADCTDGALHATGATTAGVANFTGVPVTTLAAGANTVRICITSASGSTGFTTHTLIRDDDSPVVSATPGTSSSGAALAVTLACSDAGAGCDRIIYTTDKSTPTFTADGFIDNGALYATPWNTPDQTISYLNFRAIDLAGNVSVEEVESYLVDSDLPYVRITYNQYATENKNGSDAGYTFQWRTDRAGLPYSVRIGGSSCASGTLSTGVGATGTTIASHTFTSFVNRSQLNTGVSHLIRICVENLVGKFGSSNFGLLACDTEFHTEGLTCVANEQEEQIDNGTFYDTWTPTTGIWERILVCDDEYHIVDGDSCAVDCTIEQREDGHWQKCYDGIDDRYVLDVLCPQNTCHIGRWFYVYFRFDSDPSHPGYEWHHSDGTLPPTSSLSSGGELTASGNNVVPIDCWYSEISVVDPYTSYFRSKWLWLCNDW